MVFLAHGSDVIVTLLFNSLYGSIPSSKEVLMVKFNAVFKDAVSTIHSLLSSWVTKAALLALGLWCFPLQPYVYSHHPKRDQSYFRPLVT